MTPTSVQHIDWVAAIRITHPDLNKGKTFVQMVKPVPRQKKKEGKGYVSLSDQYGDDAPKMARQQKIHASIVRIFGEPSKGYTETGYRWLNDVTIPTLEAQHNVKLNFKDNLEFRIVKLNADNQIFESSGQFNVESGQWSNPWLTYDVFMQGQETLKTALYTTTNIVEKPATKVEPDEIDLDDIFDDGANLFGKTSAVKSNS
jgi:hypothetical protein